MAETVTLTDHEAIRGWAAARAGFPAIVDVSPESGTQPMLRIVLGQEAYADNDRAERPVNAGGYELVEWTSGSGCSMNSNWPWWWKRSRRAVASSTINWCTGPAERRAITSR